MCWYRGIRVYHGKTHPHRGHSEREFGIHHKMWVAQWWVKMQFWAYSSWTQPVFEWSWRMGHSLCLPDEVRVLVYEFTTNHTYYQRDDEFSKGPFFGFADKP
ncbi:unnamed protein product [Peronospora belbahrii]|uniref:Uncharacterized protein n=1 Tax=Peronospora belbahrii TaxID=622444 RepID=A0ABN8D4K7_9STRA|nr:unnamed protein product [Peronospora belbahrii]